MTDQPELIWARPIPQPTARPADEAGAAEREPARAALSPRWRHALVTLTLLLLPVVILAGAWPVGGVSGLGDDLIYYLPVRQYIGERLRAGELPLWNPFVSMGTPLAADPQSGLFYPPTWLFAVLPPLAAYAVTIVLHFAWAGAGMYRFLRASRHAWPAAFLGAIAFEFSGYMVAHRAHLTIFEAVAWLPWILYAWRRFADAGRASWFALAGTAFGLQLLVQHIQPSIITAALVTGYVAVVLWPQRRSLWWQYPAGMAMGALLAAIQLLPTYAHFAASGRGTPVYYLFIENSWVLPSALLLLFPALFGASAPNYVWTQPWWGISHFCEQWAYPSITILLLAIASGTLLQRDMRSGDRSSSSRAREVRFWWVACGLALLLALGDLTPLSKLVFHIPVYRSLRVPARWILVWSVAMPVLASLVVSQLLRGGAERERLVRRLRWACTRFLPAAALASLLVLGLIRLDAETLQKVLPQSVTQPEWSGLRASLRPGNPAIWWPLIMMGGSAALLLLWSRTRRPAHLMAVLAFCVLDLASLAAFVDVDAGTYRAAELRGAPPLAGAIHELEPAPGQRLLVPRTTVSYYHPLEVMWPLSNTLTGIPTLNGYGPLWGAGPRLLLRFMPWGASEQMLLLLRNQSLLRSLGVRFLATRLPEERELMDLAALPALPGARLEPIPQAQGMTGVGWQIGVLWPVRIDAPGLYQLELDAEPTPGSPSRWFVRLETAPYHELDRTQAIEPADMAFGPRRMRFLFVCREAVGPAKVRVKSEIGQALRAGRASFGRVAPIKPDGNPAADQKLRFRQQLPDGISLYELTGAMELVRLASRVHPAGDVLEAVDGMLSTSDWDPAAAWVEGLASAPSPGPGRVSFSRPTAERVNAQVDSTTEQILVLNESYDLGWQARIGNESAPMLRVNAICQGVRVPPGRHDVCFVYRPRLLTAGAALSVLGAALLLASHLAFRCRRG